jgi:uncharacterized protein (TIGR02391 family)
VPTLASLIPNADNLLSLEVEELAGAFLVYLNDSFNPRVNQGLISLYNLMVGFRQNPEYPGRQDEVNRALMEAWSWLQREGLIVRDSNQTSEWWFVSRRGQRLRNLSDFSAYKNASALPKGQLHPVVTSRVYPAFLRGEYDTAVFQAFREVEVAVRNAGDFPADLVGVNLMRKAFRPGDVDKNDLPGPLTDTDLPAAEREAMMSLFSGAIGVFKNPPSHRYVATDATDASELIIFASQLLRIVDRIASSH